MDVAPPAWDDGLAFPTLSTSFARAARTLGQRALYATDGVGRALVLVRALPGPLLRWWTTRAKVYVDAAEPAFVPGLVKTLPARGVSYARLGDAVWGLPPAAGTLRDLKPITTHLMTFDMAVTETQALARMESKTRAHIRKAAREGVCVEEVADEAGLAQFCALVSETSERMRARAVAAAVPAAYFRAVFHDMVPRGEAVFLLARAGSHALAGALFLLSPRRMSYYIGGSTRDRALTAHHGPSAVFWHAMRLAHRLGIPCFDLGAVTPTDDPSHPNHSVYQFKRGFGGQVEALTGGEVVLSPHKYRFQERVVLPVWKRVYPLYLGLTARAGEPDSDDIVLAGANGS